MHFEIFLNLNSITLILDRILSQLFGVLGQGLIYIFQRLIDRENLLWRYNLILFI